METGAQFWSGVVAVAVIAAGLTWHYRYAASRRFREARRRLQILVAEALRVSGHHKFLFVVSRDARKLEVRLDGDAGQLQVFEQVLEKRLDDASLRTKFAVIPLQESLERFGNGVAVWGSLYGDVYVASAGTDAISRSFSDLVHEFNSGRLRYHDFAALVKQTTPDPSLVLQQMSDGYTAARNLGFPEPPAGAKGKDLERPDLETLSDALMIALAVPHSSYTDELCQIVAEPGYLAGCQEMALEVLLDLADPASLEPLAEICANPGLRVGYGTDWRKAVQTIAFLYGRAQPERVVAALQAIQASGNDLAREAQDYLDRLHRRSGLANGRDTAA